MAKFCTECGNEVPAGVVFCTECGKKAPVDPQPAGDPAPVTEMENPAPEVIAEPWVEVPPAAQTAIPQAENQNPPPQQTYTPPQQTYTPPPPPPPAYQPQPAYTPPQQPAYTPPPAAPAAEPASKVVGTGAYFGLMLLFALPIIGFIACIIMAFAPKNRNIKNFARANLIWAIIGFILSSLLIGGIYLLSNSLMEYINSLTDGQFTGWGDILGKLGELSAPPVV